MPRYGTADAYRRVVDREGDQDGITSGLDDADIEGALDGLADWVDGTVGRSFDEAPADPTTVLVSGSGDEILSIPDAVELTAIAIDANRDGTYATSIDPAEAWVIQGPVPASRGFPHESIELLPWGDVAVWPQGRYNIRLTGRFGWTATPAGIVMATLRIAAVWRLEIPEEAVQEGTQVLAKTRQTQSIVRSLIRTYGRVGTAADYFNA